MEVSKLVYNLFAGLTTYLYRGYNPFTKYHGHPSIQSSHGSVMGYLLSFKVKLELLGRQVEDGGGGVL